MTIEEAKQIINAIDFLNEAKCMFITLIVCAIVIVVELAFLILMVYITKDF